MSKLGIRPSHWLCLLLCFAIVGQSIYYTDQLYEKMDECADLYYKYELEKARFEVFRTLNYCH